MTTAVVLVVGVGGAVAAVAATLVVRYFVRRRAAALPLPPLFFPMSAPGAPRVTGMPQFNGVPRANGASGANGAAQVNGTAYTNGAPRPNVAPPVPGTPQPLAALPHIETQIRRPVVDDRPRTQPRPPSVAPREERYRDRDERYRDAETIRFLRPSDQPLQLLPGHLEVLEGTARDREIRFVRVLGEAPQIVLGRDPGPFPNMVGLGSSTVSRLHARMDYADGCWHVTNLSQTNPLVLNDEELSNTDAARPLVDGDRLELGEVVLRFHSH